LRKTNGSIDHLINYITHTVDKENLQVCVQKIQSYLTLSIMTGSYEFRIIEELVRILDVFNDGNNKKPFKKRVEYKEFYNDAINKEVKLDHDFERWIKERERCRVQKVPFDRLKVFTFFSFPWILSSAHKADLLKISNKIN
jgi:hypothetical protein